MVAVASLAMVSHLSRGDCGKPRHGLTSPTWWLWQASPWSHISHVVTVQAWPLSHISHVVTVASLAMVSHLSRGGCGKPRHGLTSPTWWLWQASPWSHISHVVTVQASPWSHISHVVTVASLAMVSHLSRGDCTSLAMVSHLSHGDWQASPWSHICHVVTGKPRHGLTSLTW